MRRFVRWAGIGVMTISLIVVLLMGEEDKPKPSSLPAQSPGGDCMLCNGVIPLEWEVDVSNAEKMSQTTIQDCKKLEGKWILTKDGECSWKGTNPITQVVAMFGLSSSGHNVSVGGGIMSSMFGGMGGVTVSTGNPTSCTFFTIPIISTSMCKGNLTFTLKSSSPQSPDDSSGGSSGESPNPPPPPPANDPQNCEGSTGDEISCPGRPNCPANKPHCAYDIINSRTCKCFTETELCGNGRKELNEECDDGNQINTDACTNTCKKAKCGDSFKQEGEDCDDGNQNDDDACSNTCSKRPGCTQKSDCIGKVTNLRECIDIAATPPTCIGRSCLCSAGFCVAPAIIPPATECMPGSTGGVGVSGGGISGTNGGSSQSSTGGTNGGSSKDGTTGGTGGSSAKSSSSSQGGTTGGSQRSSTSSRRSSSSSQNLCGNGRFDIGEQCGEVGMPPCPGGAPCQNCRCQSRCGDGVVNNRSVATSASITTNASAGGSSQLNTVTQNTGGGASSSYTRGFCTADLTVTNIECNPSLELTRLSILSKVSNPESFTSMLSQNPCYKGAAKNEFGITFFTSCMPAECIENPSTMCSTEVSEYCTLHRLDPTFPIREGIFLTKDVTLAWLRMSGIGRSPPVCLSTGEVPLCKNFLAGICDQGQSSSNQQATTDHGTPFIAQTAQASSVCPSTEQCDDGNTRAGDGCDPCCQREPSSSSRSSSRTSGSSTSSSHTSGSSTSSSRTSGSSISSSRTSGSSTSSSSSSVCLPPGDCSKCATCGSGIFNICGQAECLSLGPCAYTERFNLGKVFGVCVPDPTFCDTSIICRSSSSSSSSRSSTGSSLSSSRSSTGSSLRSSSRSSSTTSRFLVSPPAPVVPVPPPPVSVPMCGDGFLDQGEECDDGNRNDLDACSNSCRLKRCGDGVLQSGEECDDGNRVNEDACNNNCTLKRSSSSRVSSRSSSRLSSSSSITPKCGDGVLTIDEECDDGNLRDFDGCSTLCLLEFGFCGDSILQKGLGEMCEPRLHDRSLPYSCTPDCLFLSPFCGDGKLDAGEQCDAGQRNSDLPDALCRENCSLPRCGDGILDTREQCDDKNLLNGDGCDRYCRLEYSAPPLARVIPPSPPIHPPVGDTGPATLAIMAAGASAGIGWVRRRRAS